MTKGKPLLVFIGNVSLRDNPRDLHDPVDFTLLFRSALRNSRSGRQIKNAKTTHSFISQSLGSFFNEVWMDPVGFEDEAKEKRMGV